MIWNKPLIDRLMEKVQQEPDTGCWNWTGRASPSTGAGLFCMHKTTFPAHRASYMLLCGAIPEGMYVAQKCRNKLCVNPDHLLVVEKSQYRASAGSLRTEGIFEGEIFSFDVQGGTALVDAEDAALVTPWKWALDPDGYVKRSVKHPSKNGSYPVGVHRFVMGLSFGDGAMVDHINGNKLDNRKSNLRVCTSAQNQCNTGKSVRNTSGYKGVSRKGNRWSATIRSGGNQLHIGYFSTPEEAYAAYCEAARELHGEFAHQSLNAETA